MKQKNIIIYSIAFLAIAGVSFFTYNFIAKGATYGWLQSTWSGGADTGAIANHTSNQSNWTKFFSKDSNVDTSNDQLTLSAGSSSVVDTTTTNFNTLTLTDTCLTLNTSGDQLTGSSTCYDANGKCGDFLVLPTDRSTTANWATANSYCDSLCPTCDLPTLTELQCMCTNKASFGNNFVAIYYWSATPNGSYAYVVNFSDCSSLFSNASYALYVRCIRR